MSAEQSSFNNTCRELWGLSPKPRPAQSERPRSMTPAATYAESLNEGDIPVDQIPSVQRGAIISNAYVERPSVTVHNRSKIRMADLQFDENQSLENGLRRFHQSLGVNPFGDQKT